MSYKNIDSAIATIAPDRIIKKRKSPIVAFAIIIVGLVAAFLPYMTTLSTDLASMLVIIGWLVVILGLVKLIIDLAGSAYYDKVSGTKLLRAELFFDSSLKDRVAKWVSAGDFAELNAIPQTTVSAVKVTYYAAAGNIICAQAFEFVPHNYIPMADVVVYNQPIAAK